MRDLYADETVVRVVDHLPGTKDTTGTNFCDVGVVVKGGVAVVMTALDNLVKGGAGQAVQNFNVVMGYPENTGLAMPGLHPF